MPERLPCDICGRPLYGGPLGHLDEDKAHHDAEVKRAAHERYSRALTEVRQAEQADRDAQRRVAVAREELFFARESLRVYE